MSERWQRRTNDRCDCSPGFQSETSLELLEELRVPAGKLEPVLDPLRAEGENVLIKERARKRDIDGLQLPRPWLVK